MTEKVFEGWLVAATQRIEAAGVPAARARAAGDAVHRVPGGRVPPVQGRPGHRSDGGGVGRAMVELTESALRR